MSFTLPAKRLLTIVLTAALVAMGGAGIASAAPAKAVGSLESVQVTAYSNAVTVIGWALDPSIRSRPTNVLITVDGAVSGGWRTAALLRPDVNAAHAAGGGHGFSITLTLASGKHVVCLATRTITSPASTTPLGCFAFQAYPAATKAQMLAIARTIDPHNTINWSWTALPTGSSGRAQPWNKTIQISTGNTTRYLRAVMLHEWSHVLQYRAFAAADPWGDAVQAFNALLGHPSDRESYDGVEHGADCIALAMGANYLGYGCPAALRVYGARIAQGVSMKQPTGRLESTQRASTSVTMTGWASDPSNPTTASLIQVTDNGHAATAWIATTLTRADINTAQGVTGRHGFHIRLALGKGTHRLCVTAATIAPGRASVTLPACSSVTI